MMGKLFGAIAAALLIGSQAQAAVVTGPTSVIAGQSYQYTFDTGPVELVEDYDFFILNLNVSDGQKSDYFGLFGFPFPDDNLFTFNWIFDVTGPAMLTIISTLESYKGADIEFDLNGFPVEFTSKGEFNVINFSETSLQAAVVPIGGTLPLMITAMGIFGWVARRRTAARAVAA